MQNWSWTRVRVSRGPEIHNFGLSKVRTKVRIFRTNIPSIFQTNVTCYKWYYNQLLLMLDKVWKRKLTVSIFFNNPVAVIVLYTPYNTLNRLRIYNLPAFEWVLVPNNSVFVRSLDVSCRLRYQAQ